MYLSNIELYYISPACIAGNEISIDGDEFLHITRVMRHKVDDEIYVTNGEGKIYSARINRIEKNKLSAEIVKTNSYKNRFENIYFCIPKIKIADRFEFALEKCVELGITNFIIYESERSFKKGIKPERWNKITAAAMKQSLQSFLPSIKIIPSFSDIAQLSGRKIILEQNAEKSFYEIRLGDQNNYYFIFGPEGGLTDTELQLIKDAEQYRFVNNRLRSETAVISCAVLINSLVP